MKTRYGVSPWIGTFPDSKRPDFARFTGELTTEVAIVGGGLAGCALAFGLASAGVRAHLFEAFQGSTRTGSAGLGLAIAAELVRAHGGEIRLVEGTIGATFRLTIPDRAVDLEMRRDERASA